MKIVSAVCSTAAHLLPTCSLLLITVGSTQWLMGTKDGWAVVGHTAAHFLFLGFYSSFLSHFFKDVFSYKLFFFESVTSSTQFCLTVKPSEPKIGLEHNIFIYIYLTEQSKPIRTPVEKKQQGLQTDTQTHTYTQGLTLSIAQNGGARWKALLLFNLK